MINISEVVENSRLSFNILLLEKANSSHRKKEIHTRRKAIEMHSILECPLFYGNHLAEEIL